MMAEWGLMALLLGALFSFLQTLGGLIPRMFGDTEAQRWRVAQRLAAAMAALVTGALVALMVSFAVSDFSVWVVTLHSHSAMPLPYKIAATWGHHEGSMLLWLWVLVTMGWCASRQTMPWEFGCRVLAIQGFLSLGFFVFVIALSNPFLRMFPIPLDGNDLNPILQDISLIVHPPFLYLGYVGYSIVMAFAVAALMCPSPGAWWRLLQPWARAAWMFLTLGITLGSFWAYYELGWGGWWFWDPVENASLMPWLAGLGLLHSLRIVEQTGALQRWTVAQALMAFTLSLLGTFLVRSGALSSVHAFAVDPGRGLFVLGLLTTYAGSAFAIFAWRAPHFGTQVTLSVLSRGWLMGLNSLILFVILLTVALGTLYPFIAEHLFGDVVSIGAPYFNTTLQPIAGVLFLLLGLGVCWPWVVREQARHHLQAPMTAMMLTVFVVVGLMMISSAPKHPWITWSGVAMAVWILAATIVASMSVSANLSEVKRQNFKRFWTILLQGHPMAHIGLGVCVLGMSVDTGWSQTRVLAMAPGEKVVFASTTIVFEALQKGLRHHYSYTQGRFQLLLADGPHAAPVMGTLCPEKRRYLGSTNLITEAAIYEGWGYHLYCNLGDPYPDGRWTVRLTYHPGVSAIWWGGVLMALGVWVALMAQARRRRYERQ